MPNYQNSKIYTIRSHQTDKIYIGSTCNELRKRLFQHKQDYKRFLKNKFQNVSSFEIIKYDDCYIELYEKYPCSDKMELHKREGEIIRSLNCVNKNMPGKKNKECMKEIRKKYYKKWYEENKENKKKYKKEYYQQNKEKILKQTKEKYNKEYYHKNKKIYNCVCGAEIIMKNKLRHEKSKKHINFINQ